MLKRGLCSFILLMGCSQITETKMVSQNQNLNSVSSLPSACLNQTSVSRPARLCGEEGYTYLLNTFVRKNCASICHVSQNSLLLTPFADADAHLSYLYAVNYPNAAFEDRFMHNGFVPGECLLKEGYSQLNDLREWANNKIGSCP